MEEEWRVIDNTRMIGIVFCGLGGRTDREREESVLSKLIFLVLPHPPLRNELIRSVPISWVTLDRVSRDADMNVSWDEKFINAEALWWCATEDLGGDGRL
jgi:hypothetical protein